VRQHARLVQQLVLGQFQQFVQLFDLDDIF